MNTLSRKSPSRRSAEAVEKQQIGGKGDGSLKAAAVDVGSEGSWTTDEGCCSGGGGGDGENSCADDGIRKLEWKDGSFYIGEIDEAGVPHGHGRLVRDQGGIFDGEWHHGEVMGQGTFQGSQDIGTFSGQWRAEELISGYARVVFSDGAAYAGEWNDHKPEGYGQFINPHGVLFRGEWRSGIFQPQLSGYDPRGIVTNNRQYNFTASANADNTRNPESPNRISTTATDANLSEARLQYNGVPGDHEAQIELPAPALALRKGNYDPNSGSFLYDTQEYESQVYPDDPTKTGARLDAGYLYRTRYNTEVWSEAIEAEESLTTVVEQQQTCQQQGTDKKQQQQQQQHEQGQQCLKEEDQQQQQRASHRARKRAAASNKEGYEDPDDREYGGNDEEFPVEIENDTDQPSKPNTNTCLTCPEPLSAYRVSPAGLSSAAAAAAPPQFRSQATGPSQYSMGHYSSLPPQHVTPIAYYQPAQYMPYTPNILSSSTTGRYEVYPDGLTRASTLSTMPRAEEVSGGTGHRERPSSRGGNPQVISATAAAVSKPLSQKPLIRQTIVTEEKQQTRPAQQRTVQQTSLIRPVPVEAVTSLELQMPKLKVKRITIDYPVYAPRIIEVPMFADQISDECLHFCDVIQEKVSRLASEPQSATTLENITDAIVESLEVISSSY